MMVSQHHTDTHICSPCPGALKMYTLRALTVIHSLAKVISFSWPWPFFFLTIHLKFDRHIMTVCSSVTRPTLYNIQYLVMDQTYLWASSLLSTPFPSLQVSPLQSHKHLSLSLFALPVQVLSRCICVSCQILFSRERCTQNGWRQQGKWPWTQAWVRMLLCGNIDSWRSSHALWFILFSALSVADEQDRMQQLWALKERLPKPNLENLKWVIHALSHTLICPLTRSIVCLFAI